MRANPGGVIDPKNVYGRDRLIEILAHVGHVVASPTRSSAPRNLGVTRLTL